MSDPEDELAEDSEHLLGQVEALHRLESQKRREPISSPRFHELADAVAAKAREIMYRADRAERSAAGAKRKSSMTNHGRAASSSAGRSARDT